jgi:hypothetical protein
MEEKTKEFELAKIEESKKQFMDAHKKINHEQIQQMTKTALKKHEKVTL